MQLINKAEYQNENLSSVFLDLLYPMNKLKIFTKDGNVSVISRELIMFSSPLINNILKDIPCCISSMIFIPGVSKASIEHLINILVTGKTEIDWRHDQEQVRDVKETAQMFDIDLSNMECVGNNSGWVPDTDLCTNNDDGIYFKQVN